MQCAIPKVLFFSQEDRALFPSAFSKHWWTNLKDKLLFIYQTFFVKVWRTLAARLMWHLDFNLDQPEIFNRSPGKQREFINFSGNKNALHLSLGVIILDGHSCVQQRKHHIYNRTQCHWLLLMEKIRTTFDKLRVYIKCCLAPQTNY